MGLAWHLPRRMGVWAVEKRQAGPRTAYNPAGQPPHPLAAYAVAITHATAEAVV